jgi:predicted nucleotidyltransferase
MNASEEGIEFGAIKLLTSLPTEDNRLVKIPHIDSIEDFSRFCIEELYKYVDTEFVMLVQYDGFVLNANRWNAEFLNYDYIGAPIDTSTWTKWNLDIPLPPMVVGNGGFCIRSKNLLEISARLASEGKIPNMHPEDIAICLAYKNLFEAEGITYAPVDLAKKFSVQSDYGEYEMPFGFHGLYGKNMDLLLEEHPKFPVKYFMPRIRKGRVEKIKKVFEEAGAIEAHLQGSMARGNTDEYSDIDIWLTFKDEEFETIKEKRFEYYAQVGEVLHVTEAPQNAPTGGIFSGVIYKTKVGLLVVDYSLCPLSTSYKTDDYKKLFGDIELPEGEFQYNSEKVSLSETYRLDFFISIINGSIKKHLRNNENALGFLISEYQNLIERYDIPVKPLTSNENSFSTLKEIIENVKKVATEKQIKVLEEIEISIKNIG